MVRMKAMGPCAAALIGLSGCVSTGDLTGGLVGGEDTAAPAAMPTDTYDNCTARTVEGVNFLSTGTAVGGVSLGMSECELINVLGLPSDVTPGAQAGARRYVTMTYGGSDGISTAYVFVDNALKEMKRISAAPPAPGEEIPPG